MVKCIRLGVVRMHWYRYFLIIAAAFALLASPAGFCAVDLMPSHDTAEEHHPQTTEQCYLLLRGNGSARPSRRVSWCCVRTGKIAEAWSTSQSTPIRYPLNLARCIGEPTLLSLHCALLT